MAGKWGCAKRLMHGQTKLLVSGMWKSQENQIFFHTPFSFPIKSRLKELISQSPYFSRLGKDCVAKVRADLGIPF